MSLVHHDNNDDKQKDDPGFVLHRRQGRTLQPLDSSLTADDVQPAKPPFTPPVGGPQPAAEPPQTDSKAANPAIDLIRRKLNDLYVEEPAAGQTVAEAAQEPAPQRSKHQQFMYELSTAGKPLAEIQTAWHNYYTQLPENEKHEVWQEFYTANARQPSAYTQYVDRQVSEQAAAAAAPAETAPSQNPITTAIHEERAAEAAIVADHASPAAEAANDRRSVADIKKQLLKKVSAGNQAQINAKHHLQSLAFGLGTGGLVLVVFLFGFFNEIVIAPFIQPSRHAGATPIILSTDGIAATDTPEVIIPKLNVEIPIDYNETSIDNEAVENSLDSGVLHYPTTAVPGQQGNAAFFGHSSNNIFNKGKYKFAFVLLHEMAPGDVFYLTYNKQIYSYKVYDKKIVSPKEISVLNNVPGKTATATLITCDPPGTSLNRLVVWGEQISPDPTANSAAPANAAAAATSQPAELGNNGPTLWGRLTGWVNGLF